MRHHPSEKLPDPWLFDSETLLRELDKCRELVLQIPVHNSETHFAANRAVHALWDLQSTLQFLLQLHRSGQRAFADKVMKLQQQEPRRQPGRTEADDLDTSLRRTGKPPRNPDLRSDEEKARWQHIRAQLALKRRQERLAAREEESADPTTHSNVIRLET